ncbi:hypothetical protein BU24DRAFT_452372 [Aaosphaeria arxii CBS 175.79]|uniref:LysR family regulatory protein n=1 Tax=Aaosphaeria arxii CBS 175.79 TaxID=1450172 RepID=A0A6A5XL78_9PLEO|nr:uncharacterized protein BU24DRAFT_452372 [Aaosphaeria arxii CBS 175.79]KAF2013490.1 hypothetical protein BU24DRAFT_452372 [Aaosphaeria arxii CBS 175.79]
MDLFGLFRSKPIAPEKVPTDTVIPLHHLDDTYINAAICLDFSMIFDDVLDDEKLIGAFERLLERPGWRRLGARLRRNSKGKLEYHVPEKYTTERPCVNFTKATHDMSISQHPMGAKIPRPTAKPEVLHRAAEILPLLLPAHRNTSINDWIYTDRAQLSVHVVAFNDATVVTLSWLHTLLDAMGRNMLLRAWTAMLEGRDEDVPEFYGYDFDPLANLGKQEMREHENSSPVEEYVLKDRRLSLWGMLRFVFNLFWETTFYPVEDGRTVIIPNTFFRKLRAQAVEDLATAPTDTLMMNFSDPANPKPFLSDGDILCAWWLRLFLSCQPWIDPSRTIDISNVFGMRNLLTQTEPQLLPDGVAFIGNCVTAVHSFFTFQEILTLPLGHIATRIRRDLVKQTTRPQINASMQANREALAKGGAALYGSGDMIMANFSNWSKGKMFETNFESAVKSSHGKDKTKGRPTALMVEAFLKGFSIRNSGACVGKDADGNYWVSAALRPEAWDNVRKALEGLS